MAAKKTRSPRGGGSPGPKRKKRIARHEKRDEKTDDAKTAAKVARELSGKDARYLRGLGHHLDAVIQIGKDGITDGVVNATKAALLAHELVKVKIHTEAPIDRKLAAVELSDRAGASLAQVLGRTALLYKRHPHKPKIVFPATA